MRSATRYLLAASVVFTAAAMNSATFASIESQEPSSPTKTVFDGVYTDAQSRRGEDMSKASCVSCHGEELAGSDLAPALLGDDFKGVWSGRTVAELYEKIHTTMPADRIGTLKPQQSADLVAYILKLNDFPSGTSDLGTETAALSAIRIRSKR
jgi:mono/diheme cytochrome c family protein